MDRKIRKAIDLDSMSEEELLNVRVCDLPLSIEGIWLEDCIEKLYKELAQKGLEFRPKCYLADEWLTPEQETCIGIPFYLAHPRLIQLEKKYLEEAEGEGSSACMKLLRHEAGHALYYSYKLYNRRKWQKMFGPSNLAYPDTYKYRPYSRNFVRHLEGFYAQYHPEEDFVETFAVWLTPNLNWEAKYKGWQVLKKIRYVDKLMNEIKTTLPKNMSAKKHWRLSTLRYTLKYYYKRKRQLMAEEFADFHDPFLKKNFVLPEVSQKNSLAAHAILRKYRKELINSVSLISGEKKHTIDSLLKSIQKRSRQLNLLTDEQESKVLLNVSSYITSLAKNYQYTGRYRGEGKKRNG